MEESTSGKGLALRVEWMEPEFRSMLPRWGLLRTVFGWTSADPALAVVNVRRS